MPEHMVKKALQISGTRLQVGNTEYLLNKNVHIVAFGKAALGMVRAAEDVLKDHVVRGIASVPLGIQETFSKAGKM